jgi:hypothetical protein
MEQTSPSEPQRLKRGKKDTDIVAEGRAILGEVQKVDAELTAKVHKKFDIRAAVRSDDPMVVEDEQLGEVSFKDATLDDLFTIKGMKLETETQKTLALVYVMLKKADDTITLENVLNASPDVQLRLLEICSARSPFLQKLIRDYGKGGFQLSPLPKL